MLEHLLLTLRLNRTPHLLLALYLLLTLLALFVVHLLLAMLALQTPQIWAKLQTSSDDASWFGERAKLERKSRAQGQGGSCSQNGYGSQLLISSFIIPHSLFPIP